MNDFRTTLYDKYVSGFKRASNRQAPGTSQYHKFNFLPPLSLLAKESTILDLGCGAGELLASLRVNGFSNCRGVDLSREQVAIAQQQGLPAEQGDVFQFMQTLPRPADVIFAIDFVEHFSRQELVTLGEQLFQAIRPGGLLILQTPNGKSPYALRNIYGDLTHLTIFSNESMQQWLLSIGFINIKILEPKPSARNTKDKIRLFTRSILLATARLKFFMVTGRKEPVLSENLLIYAERPQ